MLRDHLSDVREWFKYKPMYSKPSWHKEPLRFFLLYMLIAVLWYWQWWTTPAPAPEKAALVLAIIGVGMALGEMGGKEKLAWILLLLGFLFVENRSIDGERQAAISYESGRRAVENAQFQDIANKIKDSITQGQQQFSATMTEATGGNGFPFFKPTFPARRLEKNSIFPVRVFYLAKPNAPPLVDVKVDVRLLPGKGERADKYIIIPNLLIDQQSETDDIFHPKHYDLGTILPGTFETPIQVAIGKHYGFLISTF